jgi:hypothetical protein
MITSISSLIYASPPILLVASAVCFFTRGPMDALYLVCAGILIHLLLEADK